MVEEIARRCRIALLAAVVGGLMVGCASTEFVSASYSPTGVSLPLLGESKVRVNLEILDERHDPELLGIARDINPKRIQLTQPARAMAEEAFQQLLSDAGFRLDARAPITYQVEINRLWCESQNSFWAEARASASFKIRIISDGAVLGGKLVTGFARSDQGVAEGVSESCTRAFSYAFSQAIEKAVSDEQLISLVREVGG